jgi:hypothetical protein
VRQVRNDLGRLVAAGFLRLPSDDPQPDATPTESELVIIGQDLLLFNYEAGQQTLATEWAAVRAIAQGIGQRHIPGFEDRLAERRRLLHLIDPRTPVSLAEMIDLSFTMDCSLAEAVDYLTTLFPESAKLSSLPAGTAQSDATCRRWEERTALLGHWDLPNYGIHDVTWGLTAADIVRGAALARQSVAAFLDRLESFRLLGAPLRRLDESEHRALDDRVTDRYDVAMLQHVQGNGRVVNIETVSVLWLVQVAAQYGWTVSECHLRMARLAPLGLRLEYLVDECPDEFVSWQDLLVLTVHRDGQDPVLRGTVSMDHITAAAIDVEEPFEAVKARLLRFADLFELRFDDTGKS